ncbi:MAG: 4Fe-4S dicluster domain-containing protein, partial [Betaproteobacteria bacterium AqS2]|nr:4Fe-4S dicluster domain-containing protein [Betaproteobacteria bacterium AqS2]
MDLDLDPALRRDPQAAAAAREIEKCVHCGFCLPACPTYALEHNELDSPRGRIFLVKRLLEGGGGARLVQRHLDACLSCRSCETVCPSNVGYATIAHAGRALAGRLRPPGPAARLRRFVLGEAVRS